MITILNSQYKPEAILENYWNDEIYEQIKGAYTLKFTVYMDEEKSHYIQIGNYAEVEGQYFNIVNHRRTRNDDNSVIITVECEQVSYDLLFTVYEGGFIHSGTPLQLLQLALGGTGFTIGTVQPTGYISIEIKENANARGVLMEIAAACGGELHFDKYTVSLLNRRGYDRGVQFRLGKNLKGIVKDVNGESGEVLTGYEVDVVELNTLPEFEGLEYFELGDTVDIIDEELQIHEQQRIIEYSYSPKRRINSSVVIANHIGGIQDTIYRIQTTTVGKDKWMYGVKIGPDEGIVIERYDKMARSVWNADEFRMQKGDGSGSYTDALYFDPINEEYEFTGVVRAGQFIGGSIDIGSNFSVDSTGHMRAVSAEFSGNITGSTINGGTIIGSTIKTANNGQRIEMDASGLRSYDASGNRRLNIDSNGSNGFGSLSFWGPNQTTNGEITGANDVLIMQSNQNISFAAVSGTLFFQGNLDFRSAPNVLGFGIGKVNGLIAELNALAVNMTFDPLTRNLKLWSKGGNLLSQVNIA